MFENDVATINVNDFFDAADKSTLVIEASLVMAVCENVQLPERIIVADFDTQEFAAFNYLGVVASADGKIVHWIYWPDCETMNNLPRYCGYAIKVYND